MKFTKNVVFLPAANDGCALWRFYMPHLRYPGSGYRENSPSRASIPLSSIQGFHIAVVQRLMSPNNLAGIQMLKKHGLKVVYDLDDNIWNVPKYNPAYNLFRTPAVLHGAEKCAKASDVITTSTTWLATVVKRRLGQAVRVEVVENAIDLDLFYPARKKVKNPCVVVGWAGTATHHIDLAYCMNALAKVLRDRKDFRCEFMGGAEPPVQISELIKKKTITPDRVKVLPWVAPKEYPAWVSNLDWDIALAPLAVENEFNRSKSAIKLMEASAVGFSCLASPTLEYSKFCEGDGVLENLLCDKFEDWVNKLHAFIDNEQLRIQTAEHMYQRAMAQYEIHSRIAQLNNIYESL